MLSLFLLLAAFFVGMRIYYHYNPTDKKSYNTATIKGRNNVCIQNSKDSSLEVIDDNNVVVNNERIEIPEWVKKLNKNLEVSLIDNELIVNGCNYNFELGVFEK